MDLLDLPMTVVEAKQAIKESRPLLGRGSLVVAALKLFDACRRETGEVQIVDAFRCLSHKGVIASLGARCLYVLTGRDGIGWGPVWPYLVDRENWKAYLEEHHPDCFRSN